MTHEKCENLRNILLKYKAAFGLKFSIAKMSNMDSISAILKPGAEPFQLPPAPVNEEKKEAFGQKIDDLLAMGMLGPEIEPIFACRAFLVRKPQKVKKDWRGS